MEQKSQKAKRRLCRQNQVKKRFFLRCGLLPLSPSPPKTVLACVVIVIFALAGCTTLDDAAQGVYSLVKASAPHGETRLEIEVEGHMRTAVLNLPPGFGKNRSYPAVIVLLAGDDAAARQRAAMCAAASQRGVVAVFPTFSAGGSAPDSRGPQDAPNEVGFIGRLVETLTREYRVDSKRVYVVGFSDSVALTFRLGCELSHALAGLGAIGGVMDQFSCRPVKPLPLILFRDACSSAQNSAGAEARTVEFWVGNNGCDPTAETVHKGEMFRQWYQDATGAAPVAVYTRDVAAQTATGDEAPELPLAWLILDFFASRQAL